jgi:hypothetical protein
VRGRIGLPPGAGPVTSVDGAVGVQKKCGPGLVVIKLKLLEVNAVHFHQAHANKLLLQSLQFLVLTNNLFVEAFARNSRHTPKCDKQGLAAHRRSRDRLRVIVIDPMRGDVRILEHLLQVGLCREVHAANYNGQGSQNDSVDVPVHEWIAVFHDS